MEIKSKDLQEYKDLVYHYAIYKTGDVDVAKDIASETIHLTLLKKDEITNLKPWLIATCNNYCKQYYTTKKRDAELSVKLRNSLLSLCSERERERDYELHEAYKKALHEIPENDLKTILFYFHCKQNAKTMSDITGESYSALRKRIYRIKSTIKAETYKKLGMIASKKIVTPKINDLITKFLARFKICLENKSLHKMKYYFSEIQLDNYNPTFEIENIVDYELNLTDNIYTVYVIYNSKNDVPGSFFIKFHVNEKNQLKVITPPTKTKKMVTFDSNSEAAEKIRELLAKYPTDRTGISGIPEEEVRKILAAYSKQKE